jgi:predicted nucleic acid-binding protein
MILVDTSIWIDLLSAKRVRRIPDDVLLRFVTCGPVVQEVLQGLRSASQSNAFRQAFLALPILSDPIPLRLFLSASEIYQQGRKKGITIRSSIDCLIAAVAIDNGVPVLHRDRDFSAIARYTALEIVQPAWF